MDTLTPIETRRLVLQTKLDAAKTQKERNRLGQFATPTVLASDVLTHAHKLLPTDQLVRFLDPAIGTGSFYSALLREFPPRQIEMAAGIEIDPHYGEPARELWSGHALELHLADFTSMKPPPQHERFNLVICNPPYVRHHHVDKAEKARLQTATAAASGIRMAGLAGLYCYFLALAHEWLADDGIAGWLIPSEFMDVNYGVPVKRYLLNRVQLLRVHRFDPNDLQFGDALVSSAIVWFRKRRPPPQHAVDFSYGGTLAEPTHSRRITASTLQRARKWTDLAVAGLHADKRGSRLADFFFIKRGLATGNNGFFILSRAEIDARGLPRELFKPILPGPRFLPSDVIESDFDGVPLIARQHFILDCRLPEAQIRAQYPKLWSYLQSGKPSVSGTYLCSRRNPWYTQETRPAAPIVCTYMGRNAATREKPFRFILNHSQATAANVYLMLYPKPVLARALERKADLGRKVWEFLNSLPREALLREGRVYGGGLYKMEPKELANVPANAITGLLPSREDRPGIQDEMFGDLAI